MLGSHGASALSEAHALNINIQCTILVSYVEIYGNDILDLLKQARRYGSKVSGQSH